MIKRFTVGPKWLVDFGNEILDEVRASTVKPGANCRPIRSRDGTILMGLGGGLSSGIHPYQVFDASSGSSPAFFVYPGNHYDATGGAVWIPTLGGTPIFPLPYPTLACTTSDKFVYFKFTVNPTDGSGATPAGAVTVAEIDKGSTIPSNTLTSIYQLCDGITVTVTGGKAQVVPANMGVQGDVAMKLCTGTIVFGPQSSD